MKPIGSDKINNTKRQYKSNKKDNFNINNIIIHIKGFVYLNNKILKLFLRFN